MTDPRFERLAALIAAHGADVARWPAAERVHAGDLAAHATLEPARRDAVALDAALAQLDPVPLPPADLRRRILLAAAREPHRDARGIAGLLADLWRELGGTRIAAPALALALATGLGLGWEAVPATDAADDGEDLVLLAQFDDSYTEFLP